MDICNIILLTLFVIVCILLCIICSKHIKKYNSYKQQECQFAKESSKIDVTLNNSNIRSKKKDNSKCNSSKCNCDKCNSGKCNSGKCNSGKCNCDKCNSGKCNCDKCNCDKWYPYDIITNSVQCRPIVPGGVNLNMTVEEYKKGAKKYVNPFDLEECFQNKCVRI